MLLYFVFGKVTFGEALRLAKRSAPPQGDWDSDRHEFQQAFDCMARFKKIAVGDLAVLTTEKAPKLRVVSAVTGQQVSLIDFGGEDGEIRFLRDRVIKVSR